MNPGEEITNPDDRMSIRMRNSQFRMRKPQIRMISPGDGWQFVPQDCKVVSLLVCIIGSQFRVIICLEAGIITKTVRMIVNTNLPCRYQRDSKSG